MTVHGDRCSRGYGTGKLCTGIAVAPQHDERHGAACQFRIVFTHRTPAGTSRAIMAIVRVRRAKAAASVRV